MTLSTPCGLCPSAHRPARCSVSAWTASWPNSNPATTPSATPAPASRDDRPRTRRPCDLRIRLFRALYQDLDLHQAGSLYIVTPKGTPLLASRNLADIARQLTTRPQPGLPTDRTTPP